MTEEMMNKYLIFQLDEAYALELYKVIEIIELQKITKVPETPDYIPGVMNLHGLVLPIIDVRARFKKTDESGVKRKCVIVVDFNGMRLGLIVDNVVDLVTISDAKVTPPPTVGTHYSHVFIKAIGVYENSMCLILDTDKLVNYEDLEQINSECGGRNNCHI